MDKLYENIGSKIKELTRWTFYVEAVAAIIGGIVLVAEDSDMFLIGLLVIVLGVCVAYVGSWLLYGFGEIIDQLCKIEENTRINEGQGAFERNTRINEGQGTFERNTRIIGAQASTVKHTQGVHSEKTASAGEWKCSCGRMHPRYVTSCPCGKSKHDQ